MCPSGGGRRVFSLYCRICHKLRKYKYNKKPIFYNFENLCIFKFSIRAKLYFIQNTSLILAILETSSARESKIATAMESPMLHPFISSHCQHQDLCSMLILDFLEILFIYSLRGEQKCISDGGPLSVLIY